MIISSDSFTSGQFIPLKYSGYGDNVNPQLKITDVPKGTKSLVLIVEDPDSPGKVWQHWLVWNIPANTTVIEENSVPESAVEGLNDFGEANYGGPMPHAGTHHYYFNLYALSRSLDLQQGAKRQDLDSAMIDCAIGHAELVGLYSAQ